MPNWLEVYRSKMVTAEKAVEAIQSNQRAFLNAAWPYIHDITTHGVEAAIDRNPALRRGVVTHAGQLVEGK